MGRRGRAPLCRHADADQRDAAGSLAVCWQVVEAFKESLMAHKNSHQAEREKHAEILNEHSSLRERHDHLEALFSEQFLFSEPSLRAWNLSPGWFR